MNIQREIIRLKQITKKITEEKHFLYLGLVLAVMVTTYFYSHYSETTVNVYHKSTANNFSGGKVLGNNGKTLYQRKERVFHGKLKKVNKRLNIYGNKIENINNSINEIKDILKKKKHSSKEVSTNTNINNLNTSVEFSPPSSNLKATSVSTVNGMKVIGSTQKKRKFTKTNHGPSIISFPVQEKKRTKEIGVKLPAGSFVKAKLLTGVEAPEGKALPVLLQTDYAFIGPNKTRIDLTGCFLIAKSTGNLSIERVEMQATKISCVSKSGRMFEKKINGFVTDSKDNSFAVIGNVNSKQNRVASMAFLSSVVEGVGKAIQQAQTTSQTTPLGRSSSLISGNQGKFIAAGGVGNAASQVTQWYLKHAQKLLPTINVGSGQSVWIVTQDSVDLPNWYFQRDKTKSKKHSFTYLSRFLDN